LSLKLCGIAQIKEESKWQIDLEIERQRGMGHCCFSRCISEIAAYLRPNDGVDEESVPTIISNE